MAGCMFIRPMISLLRKAVTRKDWFCMEDYHVFSSSNLTDWTDHGVIVSQEKVGLGQSDLIQHVGP